MKYGLLAALLFSIIASLKGVNIFVIILFGTLIGLLVDFIFEKKKETEDTIE